MHTFEHYYTNQAASGLVDYSGYRYQKGNGFFGMLISGTLLPWLKKSLGYIGKNALQAGVNIGADMLAKNDFSKNSIKKVAKKLSREEARDMAKEMVRSITEDQSGSGRKKRKQKSRKIVYVRRKLIKGRKRKTAKRLKGKGQKI